MIPRAHIIEWQQNAPWKTNAQIEQDLVICRALISIFSDDFLASSLAFRGGTALHKLFLQPQPRYSEDIDLVQIRQEPIKKTVQRLQKALEFLGKASVEPRKDGIRLLFRFESEFPPVQKLKLKVEANTREHFTVLGYQKFPFKVQSQWYSGSCELTTYRIEELLRTKLRALYQRRKGRDLFDLYRAITVIPELDLPAILSCYKEYMQFSVEKPPTRKQYLQNMELKMTDPEFLGDTKALLRPEISFDNDIAYTVVKKELLENI